MVVLEQAGLLTCESWLLLPTFPFLPIETVAFGAAPRLQWRDRTGFSPVSLLSRI